MYRIFIPPHSDISSNFTDCLPVTSVGRRAELRGLGLKLWPPSYWVTRYMCCSEHVDQQPVEGSTSYKLRQYVPHKDQERVGGGGGGRKKLVSAQPTCE